MNKHFKRIFAAAAAAALLTAASMCVTAYADDSFDNITDGLTKEVCGDVTGDGKVDVTDIVKIAAQVKGSLSLSEDSGWLGDVNGDSMLNVTDISQVAAHVKGIRELPALASGKYMAQARKLVDSDDFEFVIIQKGEKDTTLSVNVKGEEYRMEMSGTDDSGKEVSMYYIIKDSKLYSISTATMTYTVTELTEKNDSASQSTGRMLGENYKYMGTKEENGEIIEVYKNETEDDSGSFYAYHFDKDGKMISTIKFSKDSDPETVVVKSLKAGGKVELPDLSDYEKKDGIL